MLNPVFLGLQSRCRNQAEYLGVCDPKNLRSEQSKVHSASEMGEAMMVKVEFVADSSNSKVNKNSYPDMQCRYGM